MSSCASVFIQEDEMQALAAKGKDGSLSNNIISSRVFVFRSAPPSTAAAKPPFLLRHIRVLAVMEMVFKQRECQFPKSFPNLVVTQQEGSMRVARPRPGGGRGAAVLGGGGGGGH